jgi:hypothetical protein
MSQIEEFTKRCQERANESVQGGPSAEANVGAIEWLVLLGPLIQQAITYLMSSLGNCGMTNAQKLASLRSGSVLAHWQVHQAMSNALNEMPQLKWHERIPLLTTGRDAILDEAKEAEDDDIKNTLDEVSSYQFDPADAWNF